VHDVAPLRFPGRQLGLSLLAWQLAWRGVQRARHVIVDSTFIARELRGYLALSPDRLHIVPLGVSPAFRPQPTEKQKAIRQLYVSENGQLLLHVGHTQARKNLPTLLKALALLRQQGREVTLVQIGGRSSRSQRELLSDLGLETVVHFLGHLPDEQLAAFYSAADAFVLPSLYEGFGLPVLEAMACGTPVVASNVASLPDVVGDAGLLVEPSSADSWAETIAQVLADSGFAAQLRERGLERVRQFTWERTASETLGVYTQMRGRIDS